MKTWEEIGFSLESTKDGSPTLRSPRPSRQDFQTGQSMHHSGGAWEETLYIYKPVIDWVRQQNLPVSRFLSVGLGMGYVELLIARELMDQNAKVFIQSFEIVTDLCESFKTWLKNEGLHPEVQATYDLIGKFVFDGDLKKVQNAKVFLLKLLENKMWQIDGALEKATPTTLQFHGIMYDAFSKSDSPALWSPDFLKSFLNTWAAPAACLGTFSCTGDLKRSLKEQGFTLQDRLGFQSKRNCTLAFRNPTSSDL